MDYDLWAEKRGEKPHLFMELMTKGSELQKSSFDDSNVLHESPTTKSAQQKLASVTEEEEAKEAKHGCVDRSIVSSVDAKDQKDAGLLQMWWGLIQDQLGTMTREIDSLRAANSQIQARLTEALMQRSGAQEDLDRVRSQLMSSLDEKASSSQHEKQGDELRQMIVSLGNELRKEVSQRAAAFDELWQAHKKEATERATRDEELAESGRRHTTALETEAQNFSSCLQMLQSQVTSISKSLSSEREEWAQRRADAQAKQDLHQKALVEHVAAEKMTREQQIQSMLSQVRSDRDATHAEFLNRVVEEETTRMTAVAALDGRVRELQQVFEQSISDCQSNLGELREQSVDDRRFRTASFENLNGQVEMVRGALTQMFSDSEVRQEAVQKEMAEERQMRLALAGQVVDVKGAFDANTAEVSVLSEACADVHRHVADLEGNIAGLRGTLPALQAEVQAIDKALLDGHQDFREQLLAEQHRREQNVSGLVHKVDTCDAKSGAAQQEVSASFDALKDIMAEERAAHEASLTSLADSLRHEFGQMEFNRSSANDAQVKKLVTELCAKEREQAKTFLAQAKQILESDEVLRQRLQTVLQFEMVTKDEFAEEIKNLRRGASAAYPSQTPQHAPQTCSRNVSPVRDRLPTTQFLPASSREQLTPANAREPSVQIGSKYSSPPRERPPSTASIFQANAGSSVSVSRQQSRGSSPLPPTRLTSVGLPPAGWQTATTPVASGSPTPRFQPMMVSQGSHGPPAHGMPTPISRASTMQSPRPHVA